MHADGTLPEYLLTGLQRSSESPLYVQVAERIEQAISEGILPAGTRLENEISMGERFGLSRPTMRRAIQILVDKGLLVRRRGVGTQVVHGSITRRADLSSLHDHLAEQGRAPTTQVLAFELVDPSPELTELLGVEIVEPVLRLRRLRIADEAPIAILNNHVLDPEGIDEAELGETGLYELLRRRGTALRVARQLVSARTATSEEARRLDLPRASAVLTMRQTAYDDSGHIIEIGHHSYRPDRYEVEFTVVSR